MKSRLFSHVLLNLAGLALFLAPRASLPAQQMRASPHDTTGAVVHGCRVTVVYGRPYAKGRQLWGNLVPEGEVWRTGADEATLLITEKPLIFGDTTIPAGAYTLWTLLKGDTFTLLINRQIGQWGIKGHAEPANHDDSLDLVHMPMKRTDLDRPVEQFTIKVERSGALILEWGTRRYTAKFSVRSGT